MRGRAWAWVAALACASTVQLAGPAQAAPPAARDGESAGHFEFITTALGPVRVLKVADGLVYAGVNGQLQVHATAGRERPRLVHEAPALKDHIADVAIDGNRLYVAARSAGLVVYDRSEPSRPKRLGALRRAGMSPQSLALAGNILYAAGGAEGIHVLDVSDPGNPRLLATLNEGGVVYRKLAYRAPYLFVGDGARGFAIFDASVPTVLQRVGFTVLNGYVQQIVVSEGLAYLAGGRAGLLVIDVADPRHPKVIGQSVKADGEDAVGVALHGHVAVLADYQVPKRNGGFYVGGLRMVDVQNPRAPVELANLRGDLIGVDADAERAYIGIYRDHTNATSSIDVVDIRRPDAPRRLMSAYLPLSAGAMRPRGNDVLIGSNALSRLNLERPARPHVEWTRMLQEEKGFDLEFESLLLGTDLAFAQVASDFVKIVDLSDIDRPKRVATIFAGGPPTASIGSTLYIKPYSSQADTQIYDVQEPGHPVLVGTIPDTEDFGDAIVAGHHMYFFSAFWASKNVMRVYDLADPKAPVLVSEQHWDGETWALQVIGDRLYVGAGFGRKWLRIYSVADPLVPELLGELALGDHAGESLSVCGTTAFTGNQLKGEGVWAIDAADPHAPYVAAIYSDPELSLSPGACLANGIVVARVYGPDDAGGVHVLRYTPPAGTARPR